jgi:biopolymer transport protein ExbD
MESPKNMTLPESRVEMKPRETVVIFVSPDEILVQGRAVATVADILDEGIVTIQPIADELALLQENVVGINTAVVAESLEVTILADKSVPFAVVRKIMSTCTDEGYENVSLAVTQKESRVAAAY